MALVEKPLAPITSLEVCYLGPVQPTRSSSQQSRSRRSDRSSSDSNPGTASDGFAEEEFRAGGPHLSEPPCETLRSIPPEHQYCNRLTGLALQQLKLELLRLVAETNPETNEIRFCGRRSLLEPNETPSVTVLFYGKRTGTRGWLEVARKVRRRLHEKGLSHIKVEILDPRFSQKLMPFPCSPGDAIFPIWEDVVERILHTLDLSGVFTMGCYRMGSEDADKSSLTILIGVDRNSDRNWRDLREALVDVLDSFGLPTVAILLRKDNGFLRNGTTHTPAAANCTEEVNLGYSLCPHKQKYGRGTFGGWVELRNPRTGDWVPFGLTCTRCVLPDEQGLSQADKPVVESWKWNGVPFADANRMNSGSYTGA